VARKHNFCSQRGYRALAVALTGLLVVLLWQLSPVLSTAASAAAAGPASPHPSQSAAAAHPSHSATTVQPPPAGAASAHAPELSIGVSDGRQHVQSGDLVTYAVKIHNIGKKNAPRLRVVQTLPVNMKLISASKHPAAHAGHLTWQLHLAAGRTDTFHVVGRVGQTPGQLLRLATIACANAGSSLRPIVCAAHSDELPAGAVAAAHASTAGAAAKSLPGYVRPLGAALVLAVAASGCWLVFLRTRRRGRRAS
jgi:uncharacterized repeat protein (TIGR01451 family)